MGKNKNNYAVWSTRIKKQTSNNFKKVGSSINIDKRLYKEDIRGSMVHTDMLCKQKIISLKEIKMRPVTETHDYEFKVKNAKKFIAKGDKVKFTIRFKGRELQHSHLGNELMSKIKEDMKEIGKVELDPKFDGKQMIMVIQPL